MAISDKDIKLLWGRAAGMCSRPDCRQRLTNHGEGDVAYLIGEMAHVIARNIGGPRTDGKGGDDTYDNLILLCPTHHRDIDKAPDGSFPSELLHSWKRQHESWIEDISQSKKYKTRDDLIFDVHDLLEENRLLHIEFGPNSINAHSNPTSNAAFTWQLRKLDTIIPNNKAIINAFRNNRKLAGTKLIPLYRTFFVHAQAFESNQYKRSDHYPLFPIEFAHAIEIEVKKIE